MMLQLGLTGHYEACSVLLVLFKTIRHRSPMMQKMPPAIKKTVDAYSSKYLPGLHLSPGSIYEAWRYAYQGHSTQF